MSKGKALKLRCSAGRDCECRWESEETGREGAEWGGEGDELINCAEPESEVEMRTRREESVVELARATDDWVDGNSISAS